MEENQLESIIEEIKSLLQSYNNELKKIESQTIKSMEALKEKYASALESLKNKFNIENHSFDKAYIKENRKQMIELYKISNQRINILRKDMVKINDTINCKFFLEKIDEIAEISNDDSSSIRESTDKSFSDDLDAEYDLYEISQNKSIDFELPDEEVGFNESSINKNNSNSSNNNFNSSNGLNKGSTVTIFMCSDHKDKKAEWSCKGHCEKKFCMVCFDKLGFTSPHGELIKISDKVNTNSNNSPDSQRFVDWVENFFKIILEYSNDLYNLNKTSLSERLREANYTELEDQIEFLTKIHEEYKRLGVLNEEVKKPNEQLLFILKKIFSSSGIILQSAKIDVNVSSEIKKHSKFFIKIFPHRNLINEKELLQRISPTLKNKYNKKCNIIEGNAFIEVNDYIDSKNHKNIYEVKETEILNIINVLNEMHNLKYFLNKGWNINENKFEIKYDAPILSPNEIKIIGGERFYNPIGWFGIGIKQKKNYDCDDWQIAYITFNKKLTNEQIRKILYLIIEKENMDILVYKKEKELNCNKIGSGIYLFQNISKAEKKTGEFDINGKKYKILLMAKVQKDKIKEPINNKRGYWVVEKDFVKIYRILFK